MNKVQRDYLGTVSGIEYISMDRFDELKDGLKCDMFISTFALGESSNLCIETIMNTRFFGAKHILWICNNKSNTVSNIGELMPRIEKEYKIHEFDVDTFYIAI